MSQIYNIKYIDAHHGYGSEIPDIENLPVQEAYGYVERNGENILVIYAKKAGTNIRGIKDSKEKILAGLIIPDTALLSVVESFDTHILDDIKLGTKIEVIWRDVTFGAEMLRRDVSVMNSKGTLKKIVKDHIILWNPKTVRIHP